MESTEQTNTEEMTTEELNVLISKQLSKLIEINRYNKYLNLVGSIPKMYDWYKDKQNNDLTFTLNFDEYLFTQNIESFEDKQTLIDDFVEFFDNSLSAGISINGYHQDVYNIQYKTGDFTGIFVGFDINEIRYFLVLEILEYDLDDDTNLYVGRVSLS